MNTRKKRLEPEQKKKGIKREAITPDLPPSPCASCPRATKDTCHKPVNPDYQTTCRKWNLWFRRVWPVVTGRIKEGIRGEPNF